MMMSLIVNVVNDDTTVSGENAGAHILIFSDDESDFDDDIDENNDENVPVSLDTVDFQLLMDDVEAVASVFDITSVVLDD